MGRESEEKALAEIAKRLDEGGLLEKMKAIYPLIGGYAEKTICFDLKGSMLVKSILRKRYISRIFPANREEDLNIFRCRA